LLDPTQSTSNGRTVRSRSTRPYLRHYFRGLATAVLRHDDQHTGSGGLLDVRSKATMLQLTGDNGGKGMNWDLNLRHVQTDDAAQRRLPWRTSISRSVIPSTPASARLSPPATKSMTFTPWAPRRGKVRFGGRRVDALAPPRLAASIGHRYFGKTYSLDAGYRLRNMFWTLNYSEDITSTRGSS
jgi:uncharacterized protein (PEP-CTERM system associated)